MNYRGPDFGITEAIEVQSNKSCVSSYLQYTIKLTPELDPSANAHRRRVR